MIREITREEAAKIKNPVFRKYAHMYLDIYDDFTARAQQMGLPFCREQEQDEVSQRLLEELKQMGISFRCNGASLVYNRLSPACLACKKGIGTVTSHISFRCHRRCFFCFNPNQDNFTAGSHRKNNWRRELEQIKRQGGGVSHIALTGGEPLLYPKEAAAFFQKAGELFDGVHRRLYTSGDLLSKDMLKRFQENGLEEIRFSYKIEDENAMKERVLYNIEMAKEFIPAVMVEMPVMPDALEEMKGLLECLDGMGIFGINLLELGFPFYNAKAFREKGYKLKYPPYKTLYDFSYAGGLPVDGSERTALKLLGYAAKKNMGMGVHYCSMENKNFGQLYQQNRICKNHGDDTLFFSERDYYLKTIKAFGDDGEMVCEIFKKAGVSGYFWDRELGFIQFHPDNGILLEDYPLELAVSVNVMEERNGQSLIRELKLQKISAADCRRENL